MRQYQRPRTRIGRLLGHWAIWPAIVGFILGFAVYYSVPAHADGLDRFEADYVASYGTAVCEVLDEYPNANGVIGIGRGIISDGFNEQQAADIINAAVYLDCPRHFPLLQAIGNAARAAQGQVA